MKQGIFDVISNNPIAKNTYKIILAGDASAVTAPGQFVNAALPGFYLRRPISVCGWEKDRLTLVYKAVGRGTEEMSRLVPGQSLDILTGLGNGYELSVCGDRPLLIGGGAGAAPMYGLAEALLALGKHPAVILGFNEADEAFFESEFRDLGAETFITTADGSLGRKGFVTDAMDLDYDYFYACGPEPMLRAVTAVSKTTGQLSLERRMGCGFGACMGCSVETKNGPKRVCKEGPVFLKEDILW